MATDEYPKTFARRGDEIVVSTPGDEVKAKFDGFSEVKGEAAVTSSWFDTDAS